MANTTKTRRGHSGQWIRTSTRFAIYARDGFCCVFCSAKAEECDMPMTLDHVLARELGGSNKPSNLVTCCFSCNSTKQDKTVRAWFVVLRDLGVDTTKLGRRIRRQLAKKIDRKLGRQLVAARKENS